MKKVLTVLIVLLLFSGCGAKSKQVKVAANNESAKTEKQEVKVNGSLPESVIKVYYSLQGNPEDDNFKQCFYVPSKVNGAFLKEKAKAFKIKEVKLDKVYKVNKKDNFAVVTCIYDTYFEGINKWRKSIDFIPMINKDNTWYILNDFNGAESSETENISEMMTKAQNEVSGLQELKDINAAQRQFENNNKQFLLDSRKRLEEAIENNKGFAAE